jgi:hypothetical protein
VAVQESLDAIQRLLEQIIFTTEATMNSLIWLAVLVCGLSVLNPLSDNWQNQFVPRKRLGGPLSPLHVLMIACFNALLAVVAAAVGAACGYLLGGEAWALAWATLILVVASGHLLIGIGQAYRAVRRWRHPNNPVSPFWPKP